jgi:predicted N-acetyltransferase YhbS
MTRYAPSRFVFSNLSEPRLTAIKPLTEFKSAEIEELLDLAFGTDRHGRTAYRLRQGQSWIPALSAGVQDAAGKLIGVIQSWPVSLHAPDGSVTQLVLVGPVAVAPNFQGSGLGRAMMQHVLDIGDQSPEYQRTMMIGDPEYYGRFFGYDALPTKLWGVDGPVERHRLLARVPQGTILSTLGDIVPGWQHNVTTGRAA